MGQAKQRGTQAQRVAQALAKIDHEPNLARAMHAASRGELLRRIIPIYRQMDEQLAMSPGRIDCQDGCSFCCYYHVLVTPTEALALAEYIENLPPTERAQIMARLAATAAQVTPLSQQAYITTNIPCAFLDAGRCTVYAMRPVACRGFHSTNVAVCRRAFDDPHCTDPNPCDPHRQSVMLGYKQNFGVANIQADCEAAEYEMHGAVASALADPQAFARWQRGAVTFPTVRDRTSLGGVDR